MAKKTILTGDRPTGPLHIGHYFGSLKNRKALENDYETYVMVADVQALTDNWENPEKVRSNVFEVAADNIALGLNLSETTLFIQSQIHEIAELTVFFSNLVTLNRLKRNPTVKTEIEQKKTLFGEEGESLTYGFFGYPVSQAGDILVTRTNLVPVGSDQLPMIELAREIAEKFNRIYGEVFPLPEAKISEGARIKGLDGNAKMSKSLNNSVYLKDSPEETIKKFKTAKTDSESVIAFDPENRPEISNLVLIYSLIHGIEPEQAVAELGPIQYGTFKMKIAEDLNTHLAQFRERRRELEARPEIVFNTLREGYERTSKKAQETMRLVREAMKINYF
ncbi:MAG: tryptophan--tRNA ligase [Patescibacteria group bacterium]